VALVVDEHFSPAEGMDLPAALRAGDITAAHHFARYEWLLRILADLPRCRTLLDAGCGAGYGTHAVAARFPRITVVGVDYDEHAVREATRRFSAPNLAFRHADLMRWDDTLGPARYDVIVSFDSIEHMPHRELVMESVVRHLAARGRLALSTPSGMPWNTLEPDWSAHRIEYGTASLYDFLRRYFAVVRRPDNLTLPHADVFARLNAAGLSYLNLLNPVLCERPIRFWNPYHTASSRFFDTLSWARLRDVRHLAIETLAKLRPRRRI